MAEVMMYMGSGVPGEVAAAEAGIPRATFYQWLKKGDAGEMPYADFADGVRKADSLEHRAQVDALRKSFDEGNPHLRLAWIKQRWSRIYAEPTKVEVSGPDGGPIALSPVLASLPQEELESRIKELEAELDKPDPAEA